jgi:signal transduction histidine kinase
MGKNHKKRDLSINEEMPPFGFINWDISTDRIKICPYLIKTLAFKTTDEIQSYAAYLELTHPDDLSQIEDALRAVIKKKTPYIVLENRKLCRDGTWRWFSCRGKVIVFDINGNPLHATGMCTDITHAKENENQIQQMKLLFSKIDDIKECFKANSSLHDICMEIAESFAELTYSSKITFIFSSIAKTHEFNINNVNLYDLKECVIDHNTLSAKQLKLAEALLHNKRNIIQNEDGTSEFGVYFDLPFSQQGLLIIERNEPIDHAFANFLEPIISTAAHIISIKKLESNHSELDKFLSFFIKQVPAPVAMFDRNMRYKFVSDAWRSNFMIKNQDDIIGKCYYDLFPDTPEKWRKRHQGALRGEAQFFMSEKATHITPEPNWLEGCMHPWYALDGSIGGIIVYCTIVTKRIEAEKYMKDLVNNLSRSNQALDRFAHVCSHDLKEPLRSISNFIQLLFSHNSEQFDEESLLYMRHTLKGIDRMNTLIKDILSYSETIDPAASEKFNLDMNNLVHEIKESFDFQLNEINAQLNVGTLPLILGRKTQINQLFTNLISNAMKFRSSRPLVIDIFATERDNLWEFHVRDNGIGIAPEYHKKIFNMFKRLHSKNQYEGSGIGLATCQKIVEDHNGEIYVESPPEGGSDFVFTFPKIGNN